MEQFIYENISGKYLQHPLRLSDYFKWQPNERIELICSKVDGLVVRNIDYCGNNRNEETSFITFNLFFDNFVQI